jgi:hypothetical protein
MERMSDPEYVIKAKEYQRQYYLKHREKKLEYQKQNRERQNFLRRERRIKNGLPVANKTGIPTESKEEYNRLYHVERRSEGLLRLKIKSLQAVSGQKKPRCEQCGIDDVRVLHINHKNGGGRKELVETGPNQMRKAIVDGSRKIDDLNVLCANCNTLFEYQRGRCRLPRNYLEVIAEETT